MSGTERIDAYRLYARIPNVPDAALQAGLNLFVEREDYGFVWIAYDDRTPVAVCTITGHGLKDPDTAVSGAKPPVTIGVDLAAAARALGLR